MAHLPTVGPLSRFLGDVTAREGPDWRKWESQGARISPTFSSFPPKCLRPRPTILSAPSPGCRLARTGAGWGGVRERGVAKVGRAKEGPSCFVTGISRSSSRRGWSPTWVPALPVTHCGVWQSPSFSFTFLAPFPASLSCGAAAKALTPLEGRVPRWLLWTGPAGQGVGQVEPDCSGASGTPEALIEAPRALSPDRPAESETSGRGGWTLPREGGGRRAMKGPFTQCHAQETFPTTRMI